MRTLITGANGFLGRATVEAALRRGHEVLALVRPASDVSRLAWANDRRVTIVRADLRKPAGLVDALRGCDAVAHLAADKAGSFYAQMAANVVASENLFKAMTDAGVGRLVAISSFSVYDYLGRWSRSRLDEGSPLERDPESRDDYARTKLLQERITREHAQQQGWKLTVLRPGVIYGPDNLWNARLGLKAGEKLWLAIGGGARLPLTYVDNCADAIVACCESDAAVGQTFNVVDDDPPTQRTYLRELAKRTQPRPRVVSLPWSLWRIAARGAWLTNRWFLGGNAKVPGLFVPARLHARFKPLRYTNRKLRDTLGWKPLYTLTQALDRSTAGLEAASSTSA